MDAGLARQPAANAQVGPPGSASGAAPAACGPSAVTAKYGESVSSCRQTSLAPSLGGQAHALGQRGPCSSGSGCQRCCTSPTRSGARVGSSTRANDGGGSPTAVISFRSLTRRSLSREYAYVRPRESRILAPRLLGRQRVADVWSVAREQMPTAGMTAALRLRRAPELRSQAARTDPAVLAAIYERHHQALYRYCRSILHDDEDARDALQSTMAKALAALRDEQRDFELRPWLFRIAHNEAISRLRQRREVVDLDALWTGLGRTHWRRRWRIASAWPCCGQTCATSPSASAWRSSCAS